MPITFHWISLIDPGSDMMAARSLNLSRKIDQKICQNYWFPGLDTAQLILPIRLYGPSRQINSAFRLDVYDLEYIWKLWIKDCQSPWPIAIKLLDFAAAPVRTLGLSLGYALIIWGHVLIFLLCSSRGSRSKSILLLLSRNLSCILIFLRPIYNTQVIMKPNYFPCFYHAS